MRRIAAILAAAVLLVMCCPAAMAADREYTVEELGMTLRLPEEYHILSTQIMDDPFWLDIEEPTAYMQQLKDEKIYLLAAEADSNALIMVSAETTTAIDYRDLLEPETCLLDSANIVLNETPETTISREVIAASQTPFYAERFRNDQDHYEAMACITVMNGMEYQIAMRSVPGAALAEAEVQTLRRMVEGVWFADLPGLSPVPLTQEYRVEELGMTLMLPEQYHVITSKGISDATLTPRLGDPDAFMQEMMSQGTYLVAYAPDYSLTISAASSAVNYEDFRTQLDQALLDTESDFTELGFKTIRSRELIQTRQAPFLCVCFETAEDFVGFCSFTVMDGVCVAVMTLSGKSNPV